MYALYFLELGGALILDSVLVHWIDTYTSYDMLELVWCICQNLEPKSGLSRGYSGG